jgi:hypothetical protein
MDRDGLGERLVKLLGEPKARALLDALESGILTHGSLYLFLAHRDTDAAWLAELLDEIDSDRPYEVVRLRLIAVLARALKPN